MGHARFLLDPGGPQWCSKKVSKQRQRQRQHVFPRQIALFAAGLLFFGATTYDVHRSIKNNEQPPTREQMEALQDYINSKKQ
ncbi:unnamed protein product [Urochloa humidicola]